MKACRILCLFASCAALGGCGPRFDADLPLPDQKPVAEGTPALDVARRIRPLAEFSARVLVLSREDYRKDLARDPMSEFAPTDVVAAWGRAGRRLTRSGVSIAQGMRRYSWHAGPDAWKRADTRAFGVTTANWHLVPSSPKVAEEIRSVRKGDVVSLEGDLVSLALSNGVEARSSLTRDDAGDGACEIVYVKSLVRE